MFLSIQISCKKGEINSEISNFNRGQQDSVKISTIESNREASEEESRSFVISCGSGCAIRYTSKQITKQGSDIKVSFIVEMYEDEALTDEYDETYIFSYSSALKLENITKEGEKGNFLNTQMPDAQKSFTEFAERLAGKKDLTKTEVSTGNLFIKNKNPKVISLPFGFSQYFDDGFSEVENPYYPLTENLISYLKSKDYDAESYKAFVLRNEKDMMVLLVSVQRGDSDYFVIVTTKSDKILDFKEVGSVGSDNPVTFNILPSLIIETYNGSGNSARLSGKFKISGEGKIVRQ
jgi:hypothetical protein